MTTDVASWLEETARAHGVAAQRGPSGVRIDDSLTLNARVFEGQVTPKGTMVVMEIYAHSDCLGEAPVIETFPGLGDDAAHAAKQAFAAFLSGSFHVLLEALTTHRCSESQADVEHWSNGDAAWKVYLGPIISRQTSESLLVPTYLRFLKELRTTFEAEAMPGPHWVRVFVGAFNSALFTSEALLDNHEWNAGHSRLRSQAWRCSDEYQSVRQFMMMLPHAG